MKIDDVFDEHLRVVAASRRILPPPIQNAIDLIEAALRTEHKLVVCGNGGSAADAQHFAAECVGRFESTRAPYPVLALTTDSSVVTAIGNDQGFEHVFARQLLAMGRAGDVLLAISTSGNSANVLRAARCARDIGCRVIALTGAGGGALAALADVLVAVPSDHVARIQEVHGLCLHLIAGALERNAPLGTQRSGPT